jgi:hypothetical protein
MSMPPAFDGDGRHRAWSSRPRASSKASRTSSVPLIPLNFATTTHRCRMASAVTPWLRHGYRAASALAAAATFGLA